MTTFSTREAAHKLGITHAALSKYISAKKIPAPQSITSGGMTIHLWSEAEIEKVRKLLPRIANGRKTRWQRQRQNAAQAGVPVPHKKKKAQPRAAALPKKRGTKKKK